jgi:aspartate kinase
MFVMKFGGTSVKDAAAMDRAARIVARRAGRAPLVVVSAMSGVTSSLLEAARLAGKGEREKAVGIVRRLREQHLGLLDSLGPELDELDAAVEAAATAEGLTPELEDGVAAFGERLSSRIFASRLGALLPTRHIDSRQCLVTDDRFSRANPLVEETRQRLDAHVCPHVAPGSAVVMGGYIGGTRDGRTSTLGRGGSDYSATIFGACLGAEEVEIWTDVDGMMTADPRVVPGALTIRHISFAEASELAYFGAKVLHPSTLLPAVTRGIPVRILNSLKPEGTGTVITAEAPAGTNSVKSLASKRGITAVTITSSRMLMAHGFLRKIFEVFERHETSIDVVTTSEVSVSLTLDDDDPLDAIRPELEKWGTVHIERPLALICVVGSNLKDQPGIIARIFGCIEDVNVRMISQGASHINLSFVVGADRADEVIRRLHERFFDSVDPEIFG